MTCEHCGRKMAIGDFPFCPHGRSHLHVIGDDIPGGMVLENLGPHPVRVYSHSERKMLMEKAGLSERIRHVGERGSDKSRHTSRWV